jgi:hypothetical protein
MNKPDWKAIVAGSIKCPTGPLAAPTTDDDRLAGELRTKLNEGAIPEYSRQFAQSVLEGYIRFGHFTDNQRPHIVRLLNPQPNNDGPLAETLRGHLLAGELIGSDYNFANSLLDGFARFGRFTDKQRPHVERMIASVERALNLDGKAPESTQVTTSEGGLYTPTGSAPNASQRLYPTICATINLDKFARFTVGDLTLSLKNDGMLIYVRYQGRYAGVISTLRYQFTGKHPSPEMLAELDRIEADPLAAARDNGVLTGRCSCCGRALTDPVSIGFGIGPVCRSRGWGM